ncbi:MAG: type IV secretory system conjugative DNA transfer family protein, partial [Solirubrobacteraceae bacterium]
GGQARTEGAVPFPNEEIREPQVDPLAPVDELLHWLTGALLHAGLGVLVGMVLARLMRREHLHWSWAAVGLGLVSIVWRSLGGLDLTVFCAALCAALRGRRWHREDLEAGADLAEVANLRRTPLNSLSALYRATRLRLPGLAVPSRTERDGELMLGREVGGRGVAIPFGGAQGGRHALVLGATGSGKTVTQTLMAVSAIERGMGSIVIDPKGDPAMRDRLQRAAAQAGRAFHEWTPAGSCVYNPFAEGGETEISDRALVGERFTEPHYLRQAQRYMGHVVRALRSSAVEVSLRGIVELLDPDYLEQLARGLCEQDAQRTFAYLDSLSTRQRSDLAGVRDRLAILVESDVGRWLDPLSDSGTPLALAAAVRERSTVYFNLEADRRPLLAQMLGAAIVQDLLSTVAALQGQPIGTAVVIDEFSAIAAEQVVRLFGRARSAGFSLLLGTQELSDLRPPGRERLLEQVMGNISVLIAHRQVVPASAALIAEVAGTKGAWKVSRRSDGQATRTRTRAAVLDPSLIAGLAQGSAAVIVPGAADGARITHVFSS